MTEQATWTAEADARLRAYLARNGYIIPVGLGNEDAACSMAAINLALTGVLSDDTPACMSAVVGKWILRAQDVMPDSLRNGAEWRELLPLAAGTGRTYEQERLTLLLDWMWGTALPVVQPLADAGGCGDKWRELCEERSIDAARVARMDSHKSCQGLSHVAGLAHVAAVAAGHGRAAEAALYASALGGAVEQVAAAPNSVNAGDSSAVASVWQRLDPVGLLRRLVGVGHG